MRLSKYPIVVSFVKNNIFNLEFNLKNWYIIDQDNPIKNKADCFFQTNIQKPLTASDYAFNFIKKQNKPLLVCESNIFRKNCYPIASDKCFFRLGWNHFLRSVNFNNNNSPCDRWNKIRKIQKLEVKDWKKHGEHVLLILQKPGDSSLNKLYEQYSTYENWILDTIQKIRTFTDRKIIIRPHLQHTKLNFKKFESLKNNVFISTTFKDRSLLEGGKSLEHDFEKCHAVVGYTSNCLVESTLAGIPTFALSDESVVWDISNQCNLENIETPDINIDRTQWLYNAGYMIWTREEIANGVAWEHLKGIYFD